MEAPGSARRENAVKKRSRMLSVILSEVIVLTCLWPGSTVTAQKVTATLDRDDPEIRAVLAEIESDIEKGRQEKKIAGLSVAIVYDQEVLLSKGFGFADLDKKVPADRTTVYRVGSVTKLFTALMLMQLRDAGKLNLDDPIEKYLPEFKIKSRFPDAKPATFRQVAAHYSGLPIEPPMAIEYENPEKFPPVEEQLKSLKDVEMIVPAMSRFAYSNLGYNIMGLALSRVAKQPYVQYVDQRILKPLGMNQSGFALTESMKSHFAVGYRKARPDGTFEKSTYPEHGMASGMLYSSVDDMTRFMSLFFREDPAGGKQVLGSYSLREMTIPVAVSTDLTRDAQGKPLELWRVGSGIGWTLAVADGEQLDYKPGGTRGFTCIVVINYLRKLGMVVLMNTEGEPWHFAFAALRKLTPVVVKSLERSQAKALEEALPKWQKYTGRYVLTDPNAIRTVTFSEFVVSIVNQKLVLTVPELRPGSVVYMKEVPLEPFGDNVFHVGGGSFYGNFITFESGNGGIIALKWRNYTFNRLH
jgi:CubicO group peptidase (beta-lactamase class C family)